jgi:hypothetical protein
MDRIQQANKENINDISQASIAKSMPQINNMEELYEALQRHGYIMPKFTCQLVNKAYLQNVLRKIFWVPNQIEARIRNCPKYPTA